MKSRLTDAVDRATRSGASAARAIFSHDETIDCNFESGRLKDTGGREGIGISVDAVVAGHRGSTSGNRPDSLDALVDQAVALAKAGSTAYFESYPGPISVPDVQTHSGSTLSLSREEMIDSCAEMAAALKEYDPELFVTCSSSRSESEKLIATALAAHPDEAAYHELNGRFLRAMDKPIEQG